MRISRIMWPTLLFLLVCSSNLTGAEISGRVTGEDGPIIGASVTIPLADSAVAGTATDAYGCFRLPVDSLAEEMVIRVSALGYAPTTRSVSARDCANIEVQLVMTSIDVGSIRVSPTSRDQSINAKVDRKTMQRRAANSLVPTNPIAAIQSPQVARQGSQHSSKIRVNGTNPEYRLNGFSIGHDPTHYGVFSLLSSSVVESAELSSRTGDAAQASPAELKMHSIRPFGQDTGGELSLSVTDAAGTVQTGNDNYFAVGNLRKSVLDKLVRYLDLGSDRRTLPPTNFQDVFVSAGYRPSEDIRLFVDHYDSRDNLSFSYQADNGSDEKRHTFQRTVRSFTGLQAHRIYPNAVLTARLSRRGSQERYSVAPDEYGLDGLAVDVGLTETRWSGGLEASQYYRNGATTFGLEYELTTRQQVRMSQAHWNFLPPDAVSDNPYIYQPFLNDRYGVYADDRSPRRAAVFLTVEREVGGMDVMSGVRAQQFDDLSESQVLLFRERVTIRPTKHQSITLFAGTYAEHPFTSILEPYRVLVHASANQLKPVRTTLLSLVLRHRTLTGGIGYKKITNHPIPVPDFSRGPSEAGFVTMKSDGEARFVNFDLSADLQSVLPRVDLYGFYSYTYGRETTPGGSGATIDVPYSLTAPHRMFVEATYRASTSLSFGVELAVRSGYAYSPHYTPDDYRSVDRHTPEYYDRMLASSNSRRFPISSSLNLHAGYHFGSSNLFFNLSNVTNRANPIVNTLDGFVYDAGILPSIGLQHSF